MSKTTNLYMDQFSSKYHFPFYEEVPRFLIIASTPRSGSHLLGHTLFKTGSFGFPLEYLHPQNFIEWKKLLGATDLPQTLKKLQNIRTSPNGIFGIKLHYSHAYNIGGVNSLSELFPLARFVLLTREDTVAQAVSYAKSLQTGSWISEQKSNGKARYDYKLIYNCLAKILKHTKAWEDFLISSGFPYIKVIYDSMVADMPSTVHKIAGLMNVQIPHNYMFKPTTSSQFDNTNKEWIKEFYKDLELHKKPLSE